MAHIRTDVDGQPVEYWLIEFDKHGNEPLDSGELASDQVIAALRASNATDVFLVSHGWHMEWESAQRQYDAWIAALLRSRPSSPKRPLRPFIVGVHWPSRAFTPVVVDRSTASRTLGDGAGVDAGAVGAAAGAGAAEPGETVVPIDEAVAEFAAVLGDTPEITQALHDVLDAEESGAAWDAPQTLAALRALDRAVTLEEPPMTDDAEADEDAEFAAAITGADSAVLGDGPAREGGSPLDALRQLSFWKMKQRAHTIGLAGVADLLRRLQKAAGREARVHVMGHSFGCIVVSSAVWAGGTPPARPVGSMLLLQGALSLWSFAADAFGTGRPGRFAQLLDPKFVNGPIVTSQSLWDYALGRWYPRGVKWAAFVPGGPDHLVLGEQADDVKWGAVGTYGLRGVDATERKIGAVTSRTRFTPGHVHNIDASAVIRERDGIGGAHSDIAHTELGLLAWRGALAAP